MMRRFLSMTVVGLLLLGASTPAATVTSTVPAAWNASCSTGTPVVVNLDAPISGSTNLMINSAWRGRLAGIVTGDATSAFFTPAVPFLPGEPVEGSLSTLTTNFTWRFRPVPPSGSALFETNANSVVLDSPGSGRSANMALADLDGDGVLDVIAPSWGTPQVRIASGYPPVTNNVTLEGGIQDVAAADFNGDGRPDILLGCATQVLVVATNGGGFSFGTAMQTVAGVSGPLRQVAVGDLNGDGAPDAVAIAETSGHVIPLINNGSGVLTPGTPVACGAKLYGVDVGDLDGNGTLDVVAVKPTGYVSILLNDGMGVLGASTNIVACLSGTLYNCRVVDFDQDGRADIVVAGSDGAVAVGLNRPGGFIFDTINHGLTTSTLTGLETGDFDANGLPDIAVCGGENVVVMLGTGSNFITRLEPAVFPGEYLRDLEVGDRDGDGRVDVTICGLYSRAVYTLWNAPPPVPVILGTNQEAIVSGEPASSSRGTDFGPVPIFSAVTNLFKMVNNGEGILKISGAWIDGDTSSVFQVLNMPATVLSRATGEFQVVYAPTALVSSAASLVISNNSPFSAPTCPYVVWLAGGATNPQVVVLELQGTNQTYDGAAKSCTVTVDPPVAVEITYDGQVSPPTNAGSYVVTATVNDSLYVGSVTGLLTVAQRTLYVDCDDKVRLYGETNPVFTLQIDNYVSGEGIDQLTAVPVGACAAISNSPVGAYPITAAGGSASNYCFQYTAGQLTVTQAVLIARADNLSRPYGTANPPLTIQYLGFIVGDDAGDLLVPATALTAALTNSPLGDYPIEVSGGSAANYTIVPSNGTLTVYGLPAVVTITGLLQVYDGTPRPVTVTTIPAGLAVQTNYNGSSAVPVNAGEYLVSAVVRDSTYSGSSVATQTIFRGDQTVTGFLPASGAYSSSELLQLSATGSASGIPVTFRAVSGPAVVEAGDKLRFSGYGEVTVHAWQEGNSNWNTSAVLTNFYSAVDTNSVHYVAQAGQVPLWPYATPETAASTIQDAVDVAAAGDSVLVGAGLYGEGGRQAAGCSLTNRLFIDKPILVLGTDGPGVTVIAGRAGTGSSAPFGPDAVRCAYLTNGAAISGFTLTNGATCDAAAVLVADQLGGGVMMSANCAASNCIVSGNAGIYGGGTYGGTVVRGVLAGNFAWFEGGGASSALLNDSLLTANTAQYGGAAFRCEIHGCTLADNSADVGGGAYEGALDNSIAWYNAGGDLFVSDARNTCASAGVANGVQGCKTNAPLFANRAGGDYRLGYYSPCINAGDNAFIVTDGIAGSSTDLQGYPRVLHGTVDMGAYEYDGVPGDPVNLPATGVSAHEFQANWQGPASGAFFVAYRLELTNMTAGGPSVFHVLDAALTNTIEGGLLSGTGYAWRLRTENMFSNSAWSGWMSVTTLTGGALGLPSDMAFNAVFASTGPAAQGFVLTNSGQTACAWTSAVSYAGSAGWLTIQPASGLVAASSASDLSASVDVGGLDAGTYIATNIVIAPAATNGPLEQVVTLRIDRGQDSITFTGTNQVYTGSPRMVTGQAASGASVAITYDGSGAAPTDAGVYAVTGIVDAVNWTGTNSTVLRIEPAAQSVSQFLPAGGSYDSTNVLALSAQGGGSGIPVVFTLLSGPAVMISADSLRFTGFGDVSVRASQAGNLNWLAAPDVTNVYTVVPAPNLTHYVAHAGQSPVWPYATPATAASNIQDAVDAAWDGDRVLVGPGVYDAGGRAEPGFGLMNRVYAARAISIESSAGPGVTVIQGQAAAGGGFGSGAVRCVCLTNGATVAGFKLAGGWTRDDGDIVHESSGGGALLLKDGVLARCVVEGNRALEYGGGVMLTAGGEAVDCLVVSNSATRGGGACLFLGGVVDGCTVVRNEGTTHGGGVYLVESGEVVNSIAWSNTAAVAGANILESGAGSSVRFSCAPDGVTAGIEGCITSDPGFSDFTGGDYRPASGSGCIDAGTNEAWMALALDLAGRPRLIGGRADMGAYESGYTFTVLSAHGSSSPGTVTTNYNTFVNEVVTGSPVSGGVGTQYVCTAAVVVGNSYVQNDPTNVTLTLTNDATLTWQWEMQYNLAVETNGNGSVTGSAGWYTNGATVMLTAVAAADWHFTGWEGDTNGCGLAGTVITVPMTGARVISAVFAQAAPRLALLAGTNAALGREVVLTVSATDADGTIPSLSAPVKPAGATFTDNGDGTGEFRWTPDQQSDLGNNQVRFVASDGQLSDTNSIVVCVLSFTITSPADGAMLMNDKPLTIQWTGDLVLGAVDIELWTGAVLVATLTNNLPSPAVDMTWTTRLPDGLPPGTNYHVRVTEAGYLVNYAESAAFKVLSYPRLFWQLWTGQAACWILNTNGATRSVTSVVAIASAWEIRTVGEMSGDGTADLIWQSPASGKVLSWIMNDNASVRSATNLYSGSTTWRVVAVGDLDRDGVADVIWQLPTGQVACWLMKQDGTVKSVVSMLATATTWIVRGMGDLDGDGIPDLIWQLPTGQVACWFMRANGTARATTTTYTGTTTWIIRGTGDIDRDGISDLVWQLPTGQAACWFMRANGTARAVVNLYTGTTAWIIRGVGY